MLEIGIGARSAVVLGLGPKGGVHKILGVNEILGKQYLFCSSLNEQKFMTFGDVTEAQIKSLGCWLPNRQL